MAKLDVSTLLGDQLQEADSDETSGVSEVATTDLPDCHTCGVPASDGAPDDPLHAEDTPPVEQRVPNYLRLERKDTRLRADQLDELGRLARRLQRAKPRGSGERITENTLIRVGVDLVLALSDCLGGAGNERDLAARALARLDVTDS